MDTKNVDFRELESSGEDTSTRWTNVGDGALRASYQMDGQRIEAIIWLSHASPRVRLVLTRDGYPPFETDHPDMLTAVEASDGFVVRLSNLARPNVRGHSVELGVTP